MARFLHCADLHLGKYAYGNPERFLDMMRAFSYAADYAIKEKLDFILISGDIFDARVINSATLSQAVSVFEKIAQNHLDVYAIEGNHDRAFLRDRDSWLHFLEGRGYLKLLRPTTSGQDILFEEYREGTGCVANAGGVRLIGLGYPGASCGAYLQKLDEWLQKSEDYTVLLLHAGFSYIFTEDMGRTEIALLEKVFDRVDYIAMGHIHRREEMLGRIFMPGSTEYTDSREAMRKDNKGFFAVDTQSNDVSFIPIPVRPYYFFDVDAGENPDVAESILKKTGVLQGSPVLGITLRIAGPLADKKDLEQKVAQEAGALLAEITVVSGEGLESADDFKSLNREEFERAVLFDLLSENGMKEERAAALAAYAMELKKNANDFDPEMALLGLLEVSRNAD